MTADVHPTTRYHWLLAGAAAAFILLAGWLAVPGAIAALESFLLGSLLAGTGAIRSPLSATLEGIAALTALGVAGWLLPRLGRRSALVMGLCVVAGLLLLQIGLAGLAGLWTGLMLPALAVLGGLVVLLLIPAAAPPSPLPTVRRFSNVATDRLQGVALNLVRQGQLDLAFETYRRCPLTGEVREGLKTLANEFENRKQPGQAQAVLKYLDEADARGRTPPVYGPPAWQVPTPARVHDRTASAQVPGASPQKETLGRYEIEREIGQGAMGTVYLGRDPKINRVVAIKAISLAQEFEDADLDEVKARFFREAEMAGRLNHPGIVTVYDAGEDRGLAFIAMEYLKGRHLSHFAEAQRLLPAPQVLELIARLADALHYAHRQNVVHRDIKPANIMYDPDSDELKITDFGIARLTDTSRTKTGIVLGTPSFMSPEQLEGRTLDGRSDLFALGVSLYHLLAGQLPFRAGSMTQLMHKIASEPHPPIRTVRPELPDCVEALLHRALAKSPDDRYQTGAELAAALRSCASQLDASGP